MARKRSNTFLTETFCKSVKPPKSGHVIHFDRELKGFGLRVTANNHRAFVLRYRMGKQQRQYEIGDYPGDHSATSARILAGKLKTRIGEGFDPILEKDKKQQEAIEERGRMRSMADLAKTYMEKHVNVDNGSKTAREYQRQIDAHILPFLGRFRVASLTAEDINEKIRIRLKRTPVQANRVVALLRAMWFWAQRNNAAAWDLQGKQNPAKAVGRYREDQREVYLTEDQMDQLLRVLDEFPQASVKDLECSAKQKAYLAKESGRITAAIRLMFLTGSRPNEVLGAKWSEFDLDREQWHRPTVRNKQKKPERVPLSEDAVALLKTLPKQGEFVFPGRDANEPLTDIGGAWKKIREAAGLVDLLPESGRYADLRLHDLRHNYASWLASEGESLAQIGRLLGHSQQSTTARYVKFQDKPLREATNRFAAIAARRADASTPAQR